MECVLIYHSMTDRLLFSFFALQFPYCHIGFISYSDNDTETTAMNMYLSCSSKEG